MTYYTLISGRDIDMREQQRRYNDDASAHVPRIAFRLATATTSARNTLVISYQKG